MVARLFSLKEEYDEKVLLICFWAIFFFTSQATAQNKVVVIPLLDDEATSFAPPAPLPKTGQTESYKFRDDGYLEKGVASPSPRFTDNSNGAVTDNLTGLVWLKNANCTSFYPGDTTGQNDRIWEDAIDSCNSLFSGSCSLTDGSFIMSWRLPNRNELESLVDISQWGPSLPLGHPFIGVQSDVYWSSSADAYDTDFRRWDVHFFSGSADTHVISGDYNVWCVRDGD